MEMRFLGRSGLQVSTLGFGVMTFGESGGQTNWRFSAISSTGLADATRQVGICVDAGVNLFDTADIYAAGQSEEILGKALGARRKDVVVATKAFARMGPGAHDTGLSRRHLIDACEDSLRRLGTEWIDLYQVHSFDALTPIEETLRALDQLVSSGKICYIGCSNFAGWQLMKALGASDRLGLDRFIGQQVQYSLIVRDVEDEVLPCGVDQGVGALIWSPLASGFLSGKFRGGRSGDSRLEKTGRISAFENPRDQQILDAVVEIAAERGVSPAQVALNWLLARPGVTSLLVGARTDEQLRDNLAAADWTLTSEEVAVLDRASQTATRYPNSHHRQHSLERNPQLFARYD